MLMNHKWEIRDVKKEDIPKLQHIAKMHFDKESIEGIEEPQTIFAKTALHLGEVVGTIFAWKSSFHDACTYFRIFVHPSFASHVEEKLLRELFSFVSRENMDHLPLQTSLWETSIPLRNVYEQHGGKKVRRTYEPMLQVADVSTVKKIEEDVRIMTVKELATENHLKERLVQLIRKNYEQTHLDNPVSPRVGQDVWEKLVFANDLLAEGSYVYVDKNNEEIVAYSLLHQSDDEDTFELGWCGARDAASEGWIPQLIHYQVAYAKKAGMNKLLGEFDTTDEAALRVLAAFPFEPCATWITYSLPVR